MKITSGTFNLKVDLKEKEEKVLAEILEIVTKAMKESTVSPVVDTTSFVEQLKASAVEAVARITPTFEKVEEPINIPAPTPVAKVEENNEDVPRRFMIGQCKCGETHFLFVYDNGKTFEFKCRRCGTDHAVNYHELERAQTECVCGQTSTFFTAPNSTLKRTECKKCGALNAIQRPNKKVLSCK